ncbi:MAG TPA: glycosyltransferase family 39 protein [Polyangia bacterium]
MRHRTGLLLLLLVGALLRLPTFSRPLLSDDEAIYAATADAMAEGNVLYRDVVDHKPPAIYFIYRAGMALFGPHNTQGAHLFVVLAVLATAALLFAIGRAGWGRGPEALTAAGLFLVFSTTWHDYDALAANCELFLLLPQAAAAWIALRPGDDSPAARVARAFGVGVLIGVSALCKYQGVTFLGATAALLWFDRVHTRATTKAGEGAFRRAVLAAVGVLPEVALQLVGVAVPAALYLAYAAGVGALDATLFWFRFNFLYVDAGLTGGEALVRGLSRLGMIGAAALPVYLCGVAEAASLLRRWLRRSEPAIGRHECFLLAWLLTSVIALSAGGRFFGHYFHLVLAPLAVLAAPRCVRLWRRSRGVRLFLVAATAVPAFGFFALATFARPLAERIDEAEPPYNPVAHAIAANTGADETIFVWGNSPQLYSLARRSMGTRFSFCNYMTGESPGTATQTGAKSADDNSLAISWQMLFDDLETRKPALFVDAAAAGWDGYDKFPITRYPRLLEYLRVRYRLISEVAGVRLYRISP